MAVYIIIALLAYGLLIAIFSNIAKKRSQETTTDFFVAGRSGSALTILGTTALSIWSALAFYGYGAGIYRAGLGYFSGVAGACVVGFYAPTIMYRLWLLGKQYGYITPSDFMARRYYSQFYGWVVALICVIFVIPYIALQIIGVSNGIFIISEKTIPFWVSVAFLTVYIIGHVFEGGSKSILFSDTIAGFVGIGILVISVISMIVNILPGGLPQAAQTVLQNKPELLVHSGAYTSWISDLGLSISAGMSIIAWPHIFVRSYMAKSDYVFKVMALVFPVLELFTFFWFFVEGAYLGPVAFPGLSGKAADDLIPMMALQYTPPIIAVLLVIGVFAFGMSTADSQLLVSSSIIQKDIYESYLSKGKKVDEKQKIKFGKVVLIIMMAIVLLVVKYRPAVLVDYAYKFSAPGFAQLMPAQIGGLYWRRATKEGAISGTLLGIAAVIITLFFYNPVPIVHPILWGLLVNIIAYVLVSFVTPPPPAEIVQEIHGYLDGIFATRNNATSNILLVLIALVIIQGNIIPPYLPNPILFGWMPFQFFNWVLYAIELSILCYFYAKIQIGEGISHNKNQSIVS